MHMRKKDRYRTVRYILYSTSRRGLYSSVMRSILTICIDAHHRLVHCHVFCISDWCWNTVNRLEMAVDWWCCASNRYRLITFLALLLAVSYCDLFLIERRAHATLHRRLFCDFGCCCYDDDHLLWHYFLVVASPLEKNLQHFTIYRAVMFNSFGMKLALELESKVMVEILFW